VPVPPQKEVPEGQVQVEVVKSHVAPLLVGQQTPELLPAALQNVVLAPQVPQRPDELPWVLSPMQYGP
jgi:hypothetical protein